MILGFFGIDNYTKQMQYSIVLLCFLIVYLLFITAVKIDVVKAIIINTIPAFDILSLLFIFYMVFFHMFSLRCSL